jgi:ArsR family metal-binding transcriptional regulator
MLLRGFQRIETFFPPCHPGEIETVTAMAELTDDISPAFPYLNAVLKGTIYDQAHQSLNFKLGGRGITLHPRRIIVTRLENKEEAEKVLERLKDLINRTYERRDQLEPSYKSRAKLTVIEIYKLLPKTNCKECGEPTCMAFATKLVNEQTAIERCKPLFGPEHQEKRERLLGLLEEAGYAVPQDQGGAQV